MNPSQRHNGCRRQRRQRPAEGEPLSLRTLSKMCDVADAVEWPACLPSGVSSGMMWRALFATIYFGHLTMKSLRTLRWSELTRGFVRGTPLHPLLAQSLFIIRPGTEGEFVFGQTKESEVYRRLSRIARLAGVQPQSLVDSIQLLGQSEWQAAKGRAGNILKDQTQAGDERSYRERLLDAAFRVMKYPPSIANITTSTG